VLNALGVTPRDLISIFQALKKAGGTPGRIGRHVRIVFRRMSSKKDCSVSVGLAPTLCGDAMQSLGLDSNPMRQSYLGSGLGYDIVATRSIVASAAQGFEERSSPS